jgi:hypothetical protein
MSAQLNFDASTVAPAAALDPIPAGWYDVHITDSEAKPTGAGTGFYLELEMEVLNGPYAGRKVFDRLNLHNPNPVAVEIAYKTLSAICHATGVIQVADSAQLHNRPMQAKVAMRAAGPGKDGQNYEASNEVKGYKGVGQGAPAAAPMTPPPAPAAAPWTPPAAPVAAPAPAPAPAPTAAPWAPPAAPAPVAAAPAAPATPPWAAASALLNFVR